MYEDSKIIAMARSMGKMLQTEPVYLNFHLAVRDNDADEALQELIGNHSLAQMNLDVEMKKPQAEQDMDKIQKYSEELDNTYRAIMENPHMQAYQSTRRELEGLMQYVNNILVTAANGGDPDEVTEPGGCSGNCAGCGGGCGSCEGCE